MPVKREKCDLDHTRITGEYDINDNHDMAEPVITLLYWVGDTNVGAANHGLSDGLKHAANWLEESLNEWGEGRVEIRVGVQDVGAEAVRGRTVSVPTNTYTYNVTEIR